MASHLEKQPIVEKNFNHVIIEDENSCGDNDDEYDTELVDIIPPKVKEDAWISHVGRVFNSTCTACGDDINVFNFYCYNLIGPTLYISNLRPVCRGCYQYLSKSGSDIIEYYQTYYYNAQKNDLKN